MVECGGEEQDEMDSVSDLKSWATAPVKLCNVSAVPYTVLIDPQGKVIAVELRGEELISKVKEVLNKK